MSSKKTKKVFASGIVLLCVFVYVCNAVTPLPRIKTRSASPYAEFYNTKTGKTFNPIGNSYVQLWGGYFHCNFIASLYDANAAESALTMMQQSGYTLVRIWCYYGNSTLRGQNPPLYSIEGPYETNGPELYRPYLNNLLDFLTRANNHGIYVQLAIDRTPDNTYYNNLVNTGYWDYVTGQANREYMVAEAIRAKQIYISQLIQAMIDYDPNLLSTIFSYELRNEIVSRADEKPFNQLSGWVFTGNGVEYDMNSPTSRQACQDDNIKNWANKCIAAIKEKDPDAMACCSLFTFDCTGKNGLAGKGLLPATKPGSWPVLPSLLLETNLDYVDIHSYIPNDFAHSLESSLWSSLDKTLKPFTCGEFGAMRTDYTDVFAASSALYNYRETILDAGFRGALLFTWDAYN